MCVARFLIAIVFAVGALVACGIGLLLVGCNTTFVKERLSHAVFESTRRSLHIDGDLSLSLTPGADLNIRLGHATLSERNGTENFAELDDARMTIRLWPLLSQQPRIDVGSIEIDGLKVRLVRRKDGTLNIDDFNSPETRPLQSELPEFAIDSLRLTNGDLSLRDEADGRVLALDALKFEGGRIANAARDRLTLSAKLRTNATGTEKKNAFDISIAANYDVVLRTKHYAVEVLVAKLDGPNLGSLSDIAVRFELADLAADLRTFRIGRMTLHAVARSGRGGDAMQLEGRLTTPLTVDLVAQTMELSDVSGELSAAAQKMSLPPFVLTGRGRVDFAHRTAAGRIDSHFAGSRLAVDFAVARFVPLSLGCDLTIDRFDADRFLPPSRKDRRHGGLDMAALADFDVYATLNIGELRLARAKMHNVHLALRKPAGGGFEIDPPAVFGAR